MIGTPIRGGDGEVVAAVLAAALAVALGVIAVLAARLRGQAARLGDHERRAQLELDRREQYVAALARELMNPIAAIAYAARALADRPAGTDVRTLAGGIASEAAGATELVRELTDAARAEARHLHLALRPIDVLDVARETIGSFDPGPGHTVSLESPEGVMLVNGDRAALAKALRYLLSNAVTYAPPGCVTVRIEAAHDRRNAIVGVRDAGPGIPVTERHLLFRKFARLSTAGGTVGADLGLYLARAIVEEHGAS